jgi:hypothetical protein
MKKIIILSSILSLVFLAACPAQKKAEMEAAPSTGPAQQADEVAAAPEEVMTEVAGAPPAEQQIQIALRRGETQAKLEQEIRLILTEAGVKVAEDQQILLLDVNSLAAFTTDESKMAAMIALIHTDEGVAMLKETVATDGSVNTDDFIPIVGSLEDAEAARELSNLFAGIGITAEIGLEAGTGRPMSPVPVDFAGQIRVEGGVQITPGTGEFGKEVLLPDLPLGASIRDAKVTYDGRFIFIIASSYDDRTSHKFYYYLYDVEEDQVKKVNLGLPDSQQEVLAAINGMGNNYCLAYSYRKGIEAGDIVRVINFGDGMIADIDGDLDFSSYPRIEISSIGYVHVDWISRSCSDLLMLVDRLSLLSKMGRAKILFLADLGKYGLGSDVNLTYDQMSSDKTIINIESPLSCTCTENTPDADEHNFQDISWRCNGVTSNGITSNGRHILFYFHGITKDYYCENCSGLYKRDMLQSAPVFLESIKKDYDVATRPPWHDFDSGWTGRISDDGRYIAYNARWKEAYNAIYDFPNGYIGQFVGLYDVTNRTSIFLDLVDTRAGPFIATMTESGIMNQLKYRLVYKAQGDMVRVADIVAGNVVHKLDLSQYGWPRMSGDGRTVVKLSDRNIRVYKLPSFLQHLRVEIE